MKVKTSITLEAELIEQVDSALLRAESRSSFFSKAVERLVRERAQAKRDAEDLVILDRVVSELNAEALDNLAFVKAVFDEENLEQP